MGAVTWSMARQDMEQRGIPSRRSGCIASFLPFGTNASQMALVVKKLQWPANEVLAGSLVVSWNLVNT